MRWPLVIGVLVCVATVAGQEKPIYRSGIRTVPIYATVVDTRGRLVPGLEQSDFTLADNGQPTSLTLFSNDPQPFTAVVLLDTSASMVGNFDLVKRAVEQFLTRLAPDGRARVGAFNDRIDLSATFSSEGAELVDELTRLDIGNSTKMYDAIAVGLDALRPEPGRKVIVVFTDGEDTASRIKFKTVLDRARDEAVMVYTVGLEAEYFNGVRFVKTRPTRDLKKLAEETGGGYFELLKTADLGRTFAHVVDELRSQYLLGFAPAVLDGKTHALDVRAVRPGLTVRARRSYVAALFTDN